MTVARWRVLGKQARGPWRLHEGTDVPKAVATQLSWGTRFPWGPHWTPLWTPGLRL